MDEIRLPEYEPPEVITYTDEEILEQLGPAQALYGSITNIIIGPF